MSSARSFKNSSEGLPPSCRRYSRYKYRKMPYSTNGSVAGSNCVWNLATVSGDIVYSAYAVTVEAVTTAII